MTVTVTQQMSTKRNSNMGKSQGKAKELMQKLLDHQEVRQLCLLSLLVAVHPRRETTGFVWKTCGRHSHTEAVGR